MPTTGILIAACTRDARYFGLNVTGLRVFAVLLLLLSGGGLVVVYLVRRRDMPAEDEQWPVVIDHDRLVSEEERLKPRTIVKLMRRFHFIVRIGLARYDTEKLF